jgi:hypothetical protein
MAMKMLNGEIGTSPTLKPKKAAPKSIGTSLHCKPPGRQHKTGRNDEKDEPDQAGNEDTGKVKRVAIEADAGDQPVPDPCRWRKARADCLLGKNDRHEQQAGHCANPEKLSQEASRKMSNQPLSRATCGPKHSSVSNVLPKRHNSTPSMMAPAKAARPRMVTATGKEVVESLEKAGHRDDASNAYR